MNYFIFDDIDTRNYADVQVYFRGIDNIPRRTGTFLAIPKHNGAYFLDDGYYEDVEHSYDIIALDVTQGRKLIRDIASKRGTFRLQDSFNPDEFYEAIFVSDVEMRMTQERDVVKYTITFTRKPQRFLVSGETEVSLSDGASVESSNPYPAKPMFKVVGTGTVSAKSEDDSQAREIISVANSTYGNLLLANGQDFVFRGLPKSWYLDVAQCSKMNEGDICTFKGMGYVVTVDGVTNVTLSSVPTGWTSVVRYNSTTAQTTIGLTAENIIFNYGVSEAILPNDTAVTATGISVSSHDTVTFTINLELNYDSTDDKLLALCSTSQYAWLATEGHAGTIYGDSTKYTTGTILIDMDTGEAFSVEGGLNVSKNSIVNLPSRLFELKEGATYFYKDDSITSLKIIPRYWTI